MALEFCAFMNWGEKKVVDINRNKEGRMMNVIEETKGKRW